MNRLEKEFNIDRKREFVMGHSNGAMMAYALGATMSDRLAAVAGISGTVGIPKSGGGVTTIPDPKSPISVLLIHGKRDNVVAYKKGDKAMLVPIGAMESGEWWRSKIGVKGEAAESKIGEVATRTVFPTDGKISIELISCFNGTHEIPGGNYATSNNPAGINAMDEIWNFFVANPKR